MAILTDARVQARRDVGQSFSSIQGYSSQTTYYNPATAGQSNYLGQKLGLLRRWSIEKDPLSSGIVWRACEPKVGTNGPRTEASFGYELNTVTRTFVWDFLLPASGNDTWVSDTLSFCVVGQWHEELQPNGGRTPPFEIDIYEDSGGIRLRLVISEDGGTDTSGTVTPATQHTYELGYITRGVRYRIGVTCKAAGAADDFLNLWLQGVQLVTYSGYVGFAGGHQNFFKIGVYNYFANASTPNYRVAYHYGVVIGDSSETYSTVSAYYDTAPVNTTHINARWAVAVLGGTNAYGNSGSGVANRSLGGITYQDPVVPATAYQASLVPALANRISERHYGANVFNCASIGANITSYVGQCLGTYAINTLYTPGDIVTPSASTGVITQMSLGLKYICVTGGTSGGSAPTWPTTEHSTVTDSGGVVWIAERRESYDTAAHTYAPGELGFDPLGLLSQALLCVCQAPAADRRVLMLMTGLDTQNSSATSATAIITAWAATMGVETITSVQTTSGTADDCTLNVIGNAAANEL